MVDWGFFGIFFFLVGVFGCLFVCFLLSGLIKIAFEFRNQLSFFWAGQLQASAAIELQEFRWDTKWIVRQEIIKLVLKPLKSVHQIFKEREFGSVV